jgi:hypothetical protein
MKNSRLRCAHPFRFGHQSTLLKSLLLILGTVALAGTTARANVYATNVRLNGGTTNVSLAPGGSVTIGYLLNEPATLGVTVAIKQGGTAVRSIALTGGGPGTMPGTNAVSWDGRDDIGHMVGGGTYSVSVTASASGYTNWTQISSDANTNNQIWEPRGVAVNVNPSSPYYGRIYMANADSGPNPATFPGDQVGILKLQADSSPAAEGIFSGGFARPSKIEIGSDDRVYVNNDYDNYQPAILSFDPTVSTNSQRGVLASTNYPNVQFYDGPFVSGAGTNMQIWMADVGNLSQGIIRWNITSDGTVDPLDMGTNVVAAGDGTPLDFHPVDVAVDRSNRIYTAQYAGGAGAPDNRVLRFPAFTNVTETTNTDWIFNTNSEYFTSAYGVAVDPTATYVAVGFGGSDVSGEQGTDGFAAVFAASNGTPIVTLTPTNTPTHQFFDVAWDNAGNLYALDQGDPNGTDEGWLRIYSPPGTNQATTLASPVIQMSGTTPIQPVLSEPVYQGQFVRFTLYGEANVTYVIMASSNLFNWFPVATNTSVFANRDIVLPAPPGQTYYRAIVGQYQPAHPVLTAPAIAAGQFQFTLIGEGYLSYVILGSSDLQHWAPIATNSSPNAVRTISVAGGGAARFLRARVGP